MINLYDIFSKLSIEKKLKKISLETWVHIIYVESFAISEKVRPNYRDREAPGKIGKHAIIVNAFIVIVVVFVIILFDDSVYIIPILQRFSFH